ncbi:phenylalanine--tRNA ligase subunit alpha, partial [Pediococcus acidilactici]|nr:phenylalanine--tRNA ligase subunit alpha [Pediococcus acidilactici]
MGLQDKLKELEEKGLQEIKVTDELSKLNKIRVNLLGKKGPLTEILRGMRDLSKEERPKVGQYANQIRDNLKEQIEARKAELEQAALDRQLASETLDVTLPGSPVRQGQPHVIQQIIDSLEDLFLGMGYQIVEGPEVELDRYNFEMLNLPKDHPARDMQDTFY